MTGTILIVDDNDGCRDALEVALSKIRGLNIRMAATAEDALSALRQEPVAALITDLCLPGKSGFELISEIRSQPDGASFPIIVISGDTDPQTPERVALLGVNAYFSKPYSPSQVRGELERLLDVFQAMHSSVDCVPPTGAGKE